MLPQQLDHPHRGRSAQMANLNPKSFVRALSANGRTAALFCRIVPKAEALSTGRFDTEADVHPDSRPRAERRYAAVAGFCSKPRIS